MMMDDLAQWLRAQLDEDERIARAVEDRSAPWDGQWMADGNSAVRTLNGHVLFYRHDERPLKPGLTEHVAEWDPARVLREIDAKRKLVKLHGRATLRAGGGAQYFDTTTVCRSCEANFQFPEKSWPCTTLRLLALPYADRDGYQESWRP